MFLLGLVHSRCPRGPGWWFWGGHCYYLEEQGSKSWQEAKAACQAYGENVTLLVLSSAKEKARLFGCLFNGGKRAMARQGKTSLVPSGSFSVLLSILTSTCILLLTQLLINTPINTAQASRGGIKARTA